MRYFTPELWKNLNSTDRSIREAAYCKLEDNRKQYYQYFETIKHFVPQSVIQQIVQNQNFHDYTLTELSFFQSEREKRA